MPIDWMQKFQKNLEDEKVRKQGMSDDYRKQRIQEYGQLGTQIQDILTQGQVADKGTGSMRPLSPEEKTQLKTTQEHVNQYLQKLHDPNIDPFSGSLHEDPLHRLTDKMRLTKPLEQKGQKAPEIEKEAGEARTQFGPTPAGAGAEKRQEKEREVEQFRTLGKKYGMSDQQINEITGKMLGGTGALQKNKWATLQGSVDGQPVTWMKNEATGEITDLAGNEIPSDTLTKFQQAGKPPTSTQLNEEAYENAFDPPVKWAQMSPQQKAYYPEWLKKQSAAITTGQHVVIVTQRDGTIVPVTVQTTSERQPGAGGGTPVPPTLRGKTAGAAGKPTGAAPQKKAASPKESQPGQADPSKGWGTKKAGVVGVGSAVGEKPNKDLLDSRANYQLGVDRAKTMHRDLAAIKKAYDETGEVDQQAMLSILFNHIGMTSGAQKGTRITQTMIDEAQESAPWVSRLLTRIGVGNNLDEMGLRGIVLTSQQMQQMVDLADRKVKILFEHALDAEKRGTPAPPSAEVGGEKTSKKHSLKKAMALPFNQGKSEADVRKDLKSRGYEVSP